MGSHTYDPARDEETVRKAVHRASGLTGRHPDYPDACQVARLTLFQAAPTWDGRQPWPVYGIIVAYRAVRTWDRVRRRHGFTGAMDNPQTIARGRGIGRLPAPAEVCDRDGHDREGDPADLAEASEVAARVRRLAGGLGPVARGVADAVMAGENLRAYARRHGRSHGWPRTVIRHPRVRVAFAGLD